MNIHLIRHENDDAMYTLYYYCSCSHSILLFYRDASVPYSRTCRRDSQGTLCIRHLTDVPICIILIFLYHITNFICVLICIISK